MYIALRKLTKTEVENDTLLLKLPIVYSGKLEDCERYAQKCGYTKKLDKNSLFGQYFVNKDGDCLLLT